MQSIVSAWNTREPGTAVILVNGRLVEELHAIEVRCTIFFPTFLIPIKAFKSQKLNTQLPSLLYVFVFPCRLKSFWIPSKGNDLVNDDSVAL